MKTLTHIEKWYILVASPDHTLWKYWCDGPVSKGCHQPSGPEFDMQDLHGTRRESTHLCSPLTSVHKYLYRHTLTHTHTHIHAQTYICNNVKKKENSLKSNRLLSKHVFTC